MAAVAVVKAESPSIKDESVSPKKRKSQVEEIEVDLSLPEPPSKKAKRLLKKGKPLPVKPASDDEAEENDGVPPSKPTTKDGKEKKRSEHGVWIGNLPFHLTRVELFRWLVESSGGALKEENIIRVNLPTAKGTGGRARREEAGGEGEGGERNKPQNRGFAYVDFDGETAAVAAMALTEAELSGRKVLIKNAKSFEGRPRKEAGPAVENGRAGGAAANGGASATATTRGIPSRKIYVGNLSFQATEDDLRAQFERCGEIEWAKVATFEDSGKCKGYGWVKFREHEAAEWAAKGFVRIKEEIETEDDFREGAAAAEDDAAAAEEPAREKRFKTRKWFVNRMHGRELKIAHAEDDQTRYKKRFGKDAPERKTPKSNNRRGAPQDTASTSGGGDKKDGDAQADRPAPPEKKTYGDAGVVSYLTGSVVKSEGKKITFN